MSREMKRMFVPLDVKRKTLKWLEAGENIFKNSKELDIRKVIIGNWQRNHAKI